MLGVRGELPSYRVKLGDCASGLGSDEERKMLSRIDFFAVGTGLSRGIRELTFLDFLPPLRILRAFFSRRIMITLVILFQSKAILHEKKKKRHNKKATKEATHSSFDSG